MVPGLIKAYGLWWAFTRVIKWLFILGWPGLIIIGCAKLFGGNPDKWSETTNTVLGAISLCISVPVYLAYRRYANYDGE